MATMYEWDIETRSQEDESDTYWSCVEDHNESDSLAKYPAQQLKAIDQKEFKLVLVKATLNNNDYISYRTCAECEVGTDGVLVLPASFEDGQNIPAKFHRELKQAAIKMSK
jgi:uncharacterized CHY-type Zn-finger protein